MQFKWIQDCSLDVKNNDFILGAGHTQFKITFDNNISGELKHKFLYGINNIFNREGNFLCSLYLSRKICLF